jgi:hypothetical protein
MSDLSVQEQMAALLEAEVARGMAPYRTLGLPADVLDEMERLLRFALRTHPAAQEILRRQCEDPTVFRSADLPKDLSSVVVKKDAGT